MARDELELAQALRDGSLEMICPEMELLVCPRNGEVALQGSGLIRSDQQGRLYFRMIAPFKGNPHDVLRQVKPKGEAYKLGDHVMVRAVDEDGVEWISNPLVVRLSFPFPAWKIQANLAHISCRVKRRASTLSTVKVLIPKPPPLPYDMVTKGRSVRLRRATFSMAEDHHSHKIGTATVLFHKAHEEWLSIGATQRDPFMPDWPGALCQAIGFATAQEIHPALIKREVGEFSDVALWSGPFLRFASWLTPPLTGADIETARPFWHLVERFVLYMQRHRDKAAFLVDELTGIRNGSRGSFQTACLTLAVGVESIAKSLLSPNGTRAVQRRGRGHRALSALAKHIRSWEGDAVLKERALGAIRRLGEISAADLLHKWVRRQSAEPLLRNWKSIRHRSAHGTHLDQEQENYNDYYAVVELLYRLISSAIRYDGPILPTSQKGWQSRR